MSSSKLQSLGAGNFLPAGWFNRAMDDLPHSSHAEVVGRLRALAEGLTDAADIAAINKYVDELERKAKSPSSKFESDLGGPEVLAEA